MSRMSEARTILSQTASILHTELAIAHTWLLAQVKPSKGNTVEIGGKELELVQWHFHTPSEHAFDGERKSIEAHLVHKDTEGMLPLFLLTGTGSMLALLLLMGTLRPSIT